MPQQNDIAYQILQAIRRILRKASEHSRQLLQEAGLTVPQLLCLRAIGSTGDAGDTERTVVSVSASVGLSAPTVSRILDRLEHAGYVVRERLAADRRKVGLRLTPAGEARLANLPTPLHEQFVARLTKLDGAERLKLLRSLEQIVEMMEASDLDVAPIIVPGIDVKSNSC